MTIINPQRWVGGGRRGAAPPWVGCKGHSISSTQIKKRWENPPNWGATSIRWVEFAAHVDSTEKWSSSGNWEQWDSGR